MKLSIGYLVIIAIIIISIYYLTQIQISKAESFNNSTAIPSVYYINLDKAKNRNERFVKNNRHLKLNRIDGVSPETYIKYDVIKPKQCEENTILEMCCSISHLKAMHKAYHNSDNIILIMEDDMFFLKNPNWKELISSAPKDWDVLQLYTFDTNVYKIKNKNWINFENEMFSTGAYLMNRRSVEKMLKQFVPGYIDPNWDNIKTIDFIPSISICVADYFIYHNMKTYVHTKILLNTEGYDSYIHSDHLPSHKKFIDEIYMMNH